jgi:hypothetical protein
MMPEYVSIPVSSLLLDNRNSRLPEQGATQQATALALVDQHGASALLKLAEDIVAHHLDPMSLTAVVPSADARKRYTVLEGNRRLLAIKALESPALVSPRLKPNQSRKLNTLSAQYAEDPIEEIRCVLFNSEEEARHWLVLRHTGQNEGSGLVPWDSEMQDRFMHRQAGVRKPAGQVIDFVTRSETLSDAARGSRRKIITSLDRLLATPYFRERVGLGLEGGRVVAFHPADQVLKGLASVVEDLRLGDIKVHDLYHLDDRRAYTDSLPRSVLPKKGTRLPVGIPLDDLATGTKKAKRRPSRKAKARTKATARTTVIPKNTRLDVTHPRINAIYIELTALDAETYTNACSVLLRVFVELSVDHTIEQNSLMSEQQRRNTNLAKKIKVTLGHLDKQKQMPTKLKRAMEKVADGGSILAASVPTFHQYVHNQYVFPRPGELYSSWDELAPYMEKLWP